MSGGSVVSDQERVARAVLLRVGEPGDAKLAGIVNERGPVGAVSALRRGGSDVERWQPRLPQADGARDLATAAAVGARLLVPGDPEWPLERLEFLPVPPLGLWVRGAASMSSFLRRCVSVVGSRASTTYGEHVAAELSAGLAAAGWTVVSGGAYGIDGAAHRAALAVGGRTIAVLANGVDRAYPQGHTALLERIATEGLVVTELSPGEHPTRGRFLERNRVIAALGCGTVAVEMALRSGAATTMGDAHDLGRVYMAVPGPVTSPMSAGCHHWIRTRDAALVTGAADVLALIAAFGEADEPDARGVPQPIDALDPDSLRLWEALPTKGTRPVGELAAAAGLPARALGTHLAVLHAKALVGFDGDNAWRM